MRTFHTIFLISRSYDGQHASTNVDVTGDLREDGSIANETNPTQKAGNDTKMDTTGGPSSDGKVTIAKNTTSSNDMATNASPTEHTEEETVYSNSSNNILKMMFNH